MKPNFIIVGVVRCGTTSLFHYLDQHPDIGSSSIKEPKHFSSRAITLPHLGPGDKNVDKKVIIDSKDYYQLFKGRTEPIIGEASSDYFYFHDVTAKAIREELGDIKIIISLRNPTERAHSAYNNLIRDQREKLPFMDAILKEEERIEKNWDLMWAYKKASLYTEGVKTFQKYFTNVEIVIFDDLEAEPQKVLHRLFDFLGVKKDVEISVKTKYSHSGTPKNKLVSILTNRENVFFFNLRKIVMSLVPRPILENLASKVLEKSDMDLECRNYLRDYFKSDIEQLEKLIDKDLSHWK